MLDTLRGPIEMEKLNPVTKKPQLYPNEEDLNTFEQFDIGVGRNKIIYSQQIDQQPTNTTRLCLRWRI